MDDEIKKLQEMAGITDSEYDKAISILTRYTKEMIDGHLKGEGWDMEMVIDQAVSEIKHDIVDTLQHIERLGGK